MRRAARDGVQTGEATMKLVNFLPSFAIRSIFGVLIFLEPKQPKSPYPWSSAKIRTTLTLSLADKVMTTLMRKRTERAKDFITP